MVRRAEPVIGRAFARPVGAPHHHEGRGSATCDKFNTTGKSLLIIRNSVKPPNQKYFAGHVGQITGISRDILGPHEGRFAIVTMRRAGVVMDALVSGVFFARRTKTPKRTAKSCGPGAAMLAPSLAGSFRKVTVTTSPLHRGEHEVSRKAIAQGMSECFRSPVCSCAPFFALSAHETAGAARTRHSLRPLFAEGQRICKTSGKTCRENNLRRPGAGRDPYAAAEIV